MAKNILTIGIDEFRASVPRIESPKLVSLLKAIYQFKGEQREKMPHHIVLDIERKETIIQTALVQRGYLKNSDYAEYKKMLAREIGRKIF